jgi:hypothetical protein
MMEVRTTINLARPSNNFDGFPQSPFHPLPKLSLLAMKLHARLMINFDQSSYMPFDVLSYLSRFVRQL